MAENNDNSCIETKQHVIKFEFPQIISKSLEPLAGSIGTTLSQGWEGLTMGISLWHGRKKLEHDLNLQLYKDELQKQISFIPEENLQEPKMNIVGPALEASKFYFEEEQYREMFSKLIAGSFDNRKNEKIHPFFIEAIKQMTAQEARLLSFFKTHSQQPIARYSFVKNSGELTFKNNVFYPTDKYTDPELYSSSIENLIRLSFLNVDFMRRFTKSEFYDIFYNDPVYIETKRYIELAKSNNQDTLGDSVKINRGIVELTNLGKQFIDICI